MDGVRLRHIHWAPAPTQRFLVRDDRRSLNAGAFAAEVAGLAFLLAQKQIGRGDVVATMLPNRLDIVVAMFAAWRLGATFMPINPSLTASEALYQIEDSDCRLVVVDGDSRTRIAATRAVLLSVDARYEPSRATLPDMAVATDETALLIYTSGTTGKPKGVMLSHGNIDAMVRSIHEALALDGDLSLLVMPLFHVNALILSILAPLAAGGSAQIVETFDRRTFWQTVCASGASYFSGVPAMYLLLSAETGALARAPALRFAVCGAAPMPAHAIGAFEDRYGVPILEGYGLTESTVGAALTPLHGPRRPGSVGKAMPGIRLAILDESGVPCPTGTVGEVAISGGNVMQGYLRRPDDTAASLIGEWLRTGDLGHLDDDGWLTLVGRKKDLIIRGGENIYPSELEELMLATGLVAEAAVVGQPDDVMGEVPLAVVVAAEGLSVETVRAALEAEAERSLARFKRPTAYHFIDALPRNPIGKIDKPALRQQLAQTMPAAVVAL